MSIFDYGRLGIVRIGVIRAAAVGAAALYLWKGRTRPSTVGAYPLIVGGFVLLALGHAFSSVYPWASLQHAVNIALAATLLAWAYLLFREDPERMWARTTVWVIAMAGAQLGIAAWQRFALGNLRPNGTFDNANFLAEFLAVAALLCISWAVRPGEPAGRRAAALSGAAAFLGGALSLSASRGVLLASAPAVALLVVARFGARRGGLGLLFGAFPLLMALGAGAARRFSEPDPYAYARLLVWKSAVVTFLENPFGVGLGGFKYLWFENQFPVEGTFLRYGNSAIYAHNEYLDVLAGLGGFGILLFLVVLLYPLAAAAGAWRTLPEGRKGTVAAAASGLLVAGLHAGFDFNFHEIGLVFLAATLTGCLLALHPEAEGRRRWGIPGWTAVGISVAAILLLVVSTATMAAGIASRLGERGLAGNDLERAETAFRFAAGADPLRADYRDGLSLVNYRRYQSEARKGEGPSRLDAHLSEAIRWEVSALERSPRDHVLASRLSLLLADRYRLSGRDVDRRAAFSLAGEAIARNPYSPRLLLQRAELHLAVGEKKEAEADLLRAVTLEPNFCRGYSKLATIAMPEDPGRASAWDREAGACRERAGRFTLQENEKWAAELAGAK